MDRYTTLAFVLAVTACSSPGAEPEASSAELELTELTDTVIEGVCVHAGSVVEFRSELIESGRARLALDVNGAAIDVELNMEAMTFTQDGHLNAIYGEDKAALVALRDALDEQYPELVTSTLHGMLLVKHADRLADAPAGYTVDRRYIDVATAPIAAAGGGSCSDDGIRCFPGTSGYKTSYHTPKGGSCESHANQQYGVNAPDCNGRCGAGCKSWDDDYTQDCFDHDKCIDFENAGNSPADSDCGDEFWEADDDYLVTYFNWC